MYKVGITGGIGSGKSTTCKHFESLDVPIYDTDTRAKFVTNNNPEIRKQIIDIFGEESYVDNQMNRRYISSIVFNDKTKINSLNSIIHPYVAEDFNNWIAEHQNHTYILKETAIMFETNSHKELDKVITVYAPLDIRIQRIKLRDPQRTEEEIMWIINQQMSEEKKIKLSDYVIYNDGRDLMSQVIELDNLFRI
jgi:dephospho-CoA kinase